MTKLCCNLTPAVTCFESSLQLDTGDKCKQKCEMKTNVNKSVKDDEITLVKDDGSDAYPRSGVEDDEINLVKVGKIILVKGDEITIVKDDEITFVKVDELAPYPDRVK